MPKLRSKRSRAQMEAARKGTASTKRQKVKRRSSVLQEELYNSQMHARKKELKDVIQISAF